jgi:hypothetical protein
MKVKPLKNILTQNFRISTDTSVHQHKLKVMMEIFEAYGINVKSVDLVEDKISKEAVYIDGRYREDFFTIFRAKQTLIDKISEKYPEALI